MFFGVPLFCVLFVFLSFSVMSFSLFCFCIFIVRFGCVVFCCFFFIWFFVVILMFLCSAFCCVCLVVKCVCGSVFSYLGFSIFGVLCCVSVFFCWFWCFVLCCSVCTDGKRHTCPGMGCLFFNQVLLCFLFPICPSSLLLHWDFLSCFRNVLSFPKLYL